MNEIDVQVDLKALLNEDITSPNCFQVHKGALKKVLLAAGIPAIDGGTVSNGVLIRFDADPLRFGAGMVMYRWIPPPNAP